MEISYTKRNILGIYETMPHCLATGTEYCSTLTPFPSQSCDENINFIPVEEWDKKQLVETDT